MNKTSTDNNQIVAVGLTQIDKTMADNEIILYQPDDTLRLEVHLENETVWLSQYQISELFGKERSGISKHISNIFKEGELEEKSNVSFFHIANSDKPVKYFSLDVIISVGYRVKSIRGTQFRIWANKVLKEYLLRGYSVNAHLVALQQQVDKRFYALEDKVDKQQQIDFFVRTTQPPLEGIFFEGQIFDARALVEKLIKSAIQEIVLIDGYVDAATFEILNVRTIGVKATIYTKQITSSIMRLQQLSDAQTGEHIDVKEYRTGFHDRFLIIDDDLYHFGASFKDLGRRLFAFDKMGLDKNLILSQL